MEAYLYEDGKFTKEGESIDSYGSGLSVEKSNQTVFLSYVKSKDIRIKCMLRKRILMLIILKRKILIQRLLQKVMF